MLSTNDLVQKKEKICIVGLGYVGLPLAVAFSKKYDVVGFDINSSRISELLRFHDRTGEVTDEELKKSSIRFAVEPEVISECKLIVITVPTPIDEYKTPDLAPMRAASETVGKHMKKGSVVVYESTVYPGVTEEVCIPILEKLSGLVWQKDFNVGYSPERINPGDKQRSVETIKKIVSGDTAESGLFLEELYGSVITAGIHLAKTIKTAEAAKVIENTQRDINIALMNELSMVFNEMGIDTKEVLDAAGTKWNFLRFEPGLVGGHCIGVDPYYLTFKAQALGFHPEMILSGRRVNDCMGKFIAHKTVKLLIKSGSFIKGTKILICGFTFKEDCPDIRNTKVVDIYNELVEYGANVYVYDPIVDCDEVEHEYGLKLSDSVEDEYDAVIFAVKHKKFYEQFEDPEGMNILKKGGVIIDIKRMFDSSQFGGRFSYWGL